MPSITADDGTYWCYLATGDHEEDKSGNYRINSFGFRGVEPAFDDSGEIRVLLLGDSMPFGGGLTEAQTFPHVADRRHKRAYPDTTPVTIINASIPSFSTAQIVAFYEKHLTTIPHDIVVFAFYIDDINRECRYKVRNTLYNPLYPRWTQNLYYSSYICNRLLKACSFYEADFSSRRSRTYIEAWDDALLLLERTKHAAESRNAEFAILNLPRLSPEGGAIVVPEDYPYHRFNIALHDWCRARGVAYHDGLLDVLGVEQKSVCLSSTDNHFNKLGHELIAEGLKDFLETLVLTQPEEAREVQ